jgi:hypothetical protein
MSVLHDYGYGDAFLQSHSRTVFRKDLCWFDDTPTAGYEYDYYHGSHILELERGFQKTHTCSTIRTAILTCSATLMVVLAQFRVSPYLHNIILTTLISTLVGYVANWLISN